MRARSGIRRLRGSCVCRLSNVGFFLGFLLAPCSLSLCLKPRRILSWRDGEVDGSMLIRGLGHSALLYARRRRDQIRHLKLLHQKSQSRHHQFSRYRVRDAQSRSRDGHGGARATECGGVSGGAVCMARGIGDFVLSRREEGFRWWSGSKKGDLLRRGGRGLL